MSEHPIENLMLTAMSSIQNMVDVNTIIGETIETQNGITIIPVSRVSFGFAAGGSEFNSKSLQIDNKKDMNGENISKLPFGGGAGAGVSIHPVAFLVVQDKNVKLMPVDHESCLDKLLDYVPDLMQKLNEMFNKNIQEKENRNNKIINEIRNRNSYKNITNNKVKSSEVETQEIKVAENEKLAVNDEEKKFREADGEV